jgi:hypothetical protein
MKGDEIMKRTKTVYLGKRPVLIQARQDAQFGVRFYAAQLPVKGQFPLLSAVAKVTKTDFLAVK